ncbi:Uncharacterised protein [uncultured archaeon]|nr:Uncharacterised protein [uncultured archaeon]
MKFYDAVRKDQPQLADVNNVISEDYAADIMPLWQSASINTAPQMNKAIPLLLDMRDDRKEMKGDLKAVRKNTDIIPQMHEEIKGLREDIQPGYGMTLRQVQADIRAIKERLGMQ